MIIIKYGGSIVNPRQYSDEAIQKMKDIIASHPDKSFCFVIGGGWICRKMQEVCTPYLKELLPQDQTQRALDEIGIASTKINAQYVLSQLQGDIYPEVIINNTAPPGYKVYIAAGDKTGHTTDYDMMKLAISLKAKKAIKISNFPVVLNVKPLEFKKGVAYDPIKQMTWKQLQTLVGDEYVSGGNYPFDPAAVKLALALERFTLFIGEYEQLENMIEGKEFVGTTVEP